MFGGKFDSFDFDFNIEAAVDDDDWQISIASSIGFSSIVPIVLSDRSES